jgi:C4-type Zn-finger protein
MAAGRGTAMDCLRCHGMMVAERFDEVQGYSREISFYGWRCVCCGNIFDHVIAANRLKPHLPLGKKTRERFLVADTLRSWEMDTSAA